MELEEGTLEAVYERDVDLFLLEAIFVDPEFRRWLIAEGGLDPGSSEPIDMHHSVSSETGETDIQFRIRHNRKTIAILLENKVNADFQDDQLKRYQLRGERLESSDDYRVVLLAPQSYLENVDSAQVDATISYQAIRDWLDGRGEATSTFKSYVLDHAIHKYRRGRRLNKDEQVTRFAEYYWEIAKHDFPELDMENPGERSTGGKWIWFGNPLPDGVKLRHKLDSGEVDLVFEGAARQEAAFRSKYRPLVEPDMDLERRSGSMGIVRSVPELDRHEDPEPQESAIRSGLRAASHLLDWFNEIQSADTRLTAAIDLIRDADEQDVHLLDEEYRQDALKLRNA